MSADTTSENIIPIFPYFETIKGSFVRCEGTNCKHYHGEINSDGKAIKTAPGYFENSTAVLIDYRGEEPTTIEHCTSKMSPRIVRTGHNLGKCDQFEPESSSSDTRE